MRDTHLIFIMGSGRSGTKLIADALATCPDCEVHHQYACVEVQRLGTRYFGGKINVAQLATGLKDIYGAAQSYSDKAVWIDVSNKLPWVADVLRSTFPAALFVTVLRDGRKVAASYANKLPWVYQDRYIHQLWTYLYNNGHSLPPEERYWYPVPWNVDWFLSTQKHERAAWYWQMTYSRALRCTSKEHVYRLEDITADRGNAAAFLDALDLAAEAAAINILTGRPVNVIEPKSYDLPNTAFFENEPAVYELINRYYPEGEGKPLNYALPSMPPTDA